VERVQILLDRALIVVSTSIPQLVTTARIEELHDRITDLGIVITQFGEQASNRSLADLTNYAEQLASELIIWPVAVTDDWKEAVTSAASAYRRSAGQQIRDVLNQTRALHEELQQLSSRITSVDEARAASDAELSELVEERAARIEGRYNKLDAMQASANSQIDANVARIDQAVARFEEQFSTGQQSRTDEFNTEVKRLTTQANALSVQLTDDAQDIIEKIEAQHEKSADLVSVFAAGGTANAYGEEANRQGKIADRLRIATIVFAVLAGIAAYWLAHTAARDSSLSVATIASRLFLSVLAGSVASYAAAQSARHRKREEQNRQMELQLVAFEPFIRELKDEEKDKARVTVVNRIFNSDPSHADDQSTPSITNDQIGLLQKIVGLFPPR